MPIRIEMTDGRELLLDATLDQWDKAFQIALVSNVVIEVELPDGSIMTVDPRGVQSFREEPEAREALADQFPEAATA